MQNKNIIIGILVIIALVLIGSYFYKNNNNDEGDILGSSHVLFPTGGETLVAGKTYSLKWDNQGNTGAAVGPTTQIFLVDKALLTQGASVSIADRKYDVPDTGSYEYTVPTAVSDSTYFFVIGTTTSNTFTVTSSQ